MNTAIRDYHFTSTLDARLASDTLAAQGYVIVPRFLDPADAHALYDYASNLDDSQWQIAAVGRQHQQTINTSVRSDTIHWLQPGQPLEAAYLNHMNTLRTAINRELFMGLFDYESHLARYRPGAYYKKHLDAFKGRSNRVLTTVLYLNPDWQQSDGGELVIYGSRGNILEEVMPTLGTLVMFLSDTFVHEVKVGHRERYSITGWFRHNTSIGGVIDPPR